MDFKKWGSIVIVAVAIIGMGILIFWEDGQPGKYDEFASCLKEKGAIFYGAFWCPHCQSQKKIFGNSADNLNYVECSTPDGNGQLQVCKDAKIDGYPTWVFADGSRKTGELSFAELAEKTGCQVLK